jgi:hypothetical protein
VEHVVEVSSPLDDGRTFQRVRSLTFSPASCFVLTARGVEVAQRCGDRRSPAGEAAGDHAGGGDNASAVPHVKPCWDTDRRELRVGNEVVKHFRVPAKNQEIVLAAFHEDGWPPRIDDPLPPNSECPPKQRLHDTINSLNRKQLRPLIRFLGDGSGEGVRWEFVNGPAPADG